MTDPHDIWRIVARRHADLEARAPEGYAPTVKVHIFGEAEPFVIGNVANVSNGWTLLVAVEEEGRQVEVHSGDRWVYLPPDRVARVEISFERKGAPFTVGFSADELDRSDDDGAGTPQTD